MSEDKSLRVVSADEAGMRLDRWFKLHFPGLGFGALNKLLRTGQVRVDGGRVKTSTRLARGQGVRIPPSVQQIVPVSKPISGKLGQDDAAALEAMTLYRDESVIVLNKPYGLAVQGGSGLTRHVDGMLAAWTDKKGQKPRLVHRLDRETSGVLLIAKTRRAASALTKSFRARETRKIYWALVRGVPKPSQGRISTYLVRGEGDDSERMRVAQHGESDAAHAVSNYALVDQAAQGLSWVSLRPITGRTHQLRAHAEYIGHPILGDSKYFSVENWALPGGIQNRLHLLARRIVIPHPDGGTLDVSAPLPQHMQQSWNLLGLDAFKFDDDDEDEI